VNLFYATIANSGGVYGVYHIGPDLADTRDLGYEVHRCNSKPTASDPTSKRPFDVCALGRARFGCQQSIPGFPLPSKVAVFQFEAKFSVERVFYNNSENDANASQLHGTGCVFE